MTFNFDDLLLQGKGAAENVIKNREEVQSVLNDLEKALSNFLGISVKFEEQAEYVQHDTNPIAIFANPFKPREKTGFNIVNIVNVETEISKEVFKLKRSDDVYPITVVRERSHSVANDQSDFASSIGQIASNSQFHLQLKAFKKQVEAKLVENQQRIPKSD